MAKPRFTWDFDSAGEHRISEHYTVPSPMTLHFLDQPWLDYDVDLTVDSSSGVLRCVALTCKARAGGPEITRNGLREVPLRELLRWARTAQDQWATRRAGPVRVPGGIKRSELAEYLAARRREERKGRRRIPDDDLRRVGEVYKWALATGQPPTATVARELRLTRAQAGRWVRLARNAGFLGGAPGERRAGEVDEARNKPQPTKRKRSTKP